MRDRYSRSIDAGECPGCQQPYEATGVYEVGEPIPNPVDDGETLVAPVTLAGVDVRPHNCVPRPTRQTQAAIASDRRTGPHSRACGITTHEHGLGCARDCPTCHGQKPCSRGCGGYGVHPYGCDSDRV